MSTQNSLAVEATLSGGAAKLFLHLLRRGRVWGSMADMMAGAGISKPTYLAAKRELLDKEADLRGFGFLPSPVKGVDHEVKYFGGEVKEVAQVGQETFPQGVPMTQWPGQPTIYLGTTAPVSVDYDPGMLLPGGRFSGPVPQEERNFSPVSEKSARGLCQEADLLPSDGDPMRPTSSFQARRNAQVKALCLAYGSLFPDKPALQVSSAKQLLQLTGNNAEDAYDALEAAIGKDWPIGYAKKVLEAKPRPAVDHSGELEDWTPEFEAKVRAGEEKLRRKGVPAYFLGADE